MFYKKFQQYQVRLIGLLPLLLSADVLANVLTIGNVLVDHPYREPGQSVNVNFDISEDARVTVSIFDTRNYLVRTLITNKPLVAGSQQVLWDGRDAQRTVVVPGFYHYTITAVSNEGTTVTHDLTDITGGETVVVEQVRYDPNSERVFFRVPKTARIFLRVGVEGTFVAKTLLNGVVRKAGVHSLSWDGWDKSRVVNLKHHSKLVFHGDGYRPSRNTLTVFNKAQENTEPKWLLLPENLASQRKTVTKRKGLNIHAYHAPERCRDVDVTLTLPDDLPLDKAIPVLSTATPLRVSLSKKDTLQMEAERGEVVFFLDNQLIYENEASFFPYTWTWDKKSATEGIHYLTGFVLGFENHFGVSTLQVKLKSPSTNHKKTD